MNNLNTMGVDELKTYLKGKKIVIEDGEIKCEREQLHVKDAKNGISTVIQNAKNIFLSITRTKS